MALEKRSFFKFSVSVYLGNLMERFDKALFGFLSPFLATLIFPNKEPIVALIYTYALIPIGLIAKPIGSLFFGVIGDFVGRETALFISLLGMSIVSMFISFIPTHLQVGVLAPVLFSIAKIIQDFFASGESMGGAIFLLENVNECRHDLISGLYGASTMGGYLLASFGVFILSSFDLIDHGWRFLYFIGGFTTLILSFFRSTNTKSTNSSSGNVFQKIEIMKTNMIENYREILIIMICAGFGSACFSMALVLMNGFIPLITSISKVEMLKLNTYLIVFDFLALPLFAWIATKVSRERLMVASALLVIFLAFPLSTNLDRCSFYFVSLIRFIFVMIGVAFSASFHAWASSLVSQKMRYTIISIGYSFGSGLLGCPCASLSLWIYKNTGIVSSVLWYWVFLSILSVIAILHGQKVQKQVAQNLVKSI